MAGLDYALQGTFKDRGGNGIECELRGRTPCRADNRC